MVCLNMHMISYLNLNLNETKKGGEIIAEFTVPPDTTEGLHLLTVGVENAAFTADCEIQIKSHLVQLK